MNVRQTTLLFLGLFTISLYTSAFAQAKPQTQGSKDDLEKAQKVMEEKALNLLDSTLAGAQTLKLVENQALFQTVAGDLLWTREEKRARSLFQDAISALTLALNASERARSPNNSYWILAQSRSQTIQMIAGRDAQFALDLLRASHPVASVGTDADPELNNQELMLEQAIAIQAAENDPRLALKMAQENLKKGVSFNLLNLLRRLQQKDGEAATQLAVDIVRKLKTEDLMSRQAAFTAIGLLRVSLQPMRGDVDAPTKGQGNTQRKQLLLDDETVRDLAETVVNAALSASSNQPFLLMQVQSLLPDLERHVPQRALQLREKVAEVTKTIDPRGRAWMQFEPLLQNGSTDAILAAAADAPVDMRNALYLVAVRKLMEAGEMDRARQITSDNVSGTERDQMLVQIDQVAIGNAIKQQKIEKAKEIISRISSKEGKASELAELATGVMAQGDRKLALDLLEQARRLINSPPANQKQIDAVLQVAGAYALVEPARTFELIDPLIDQANEMITAAALLDKFGAGQGVFKRGEMLLQSGFSQANGPYAPYVKKLTSLARADFERTKAAADRFQRNEIRLMGRLLIAQCVLSDRLGSDKNANQVFFGGGAGGASIIVSH